MKSILIYSPREINPSRGGIERVTNGLASFLIEKGYRVVFLVNEKTSDDKYTPIADQYFISHRKQERKQQVLNLIKEYNIDIIINQAGFFSIISKKELPDNIRVISVIHDSYYAMYKHLPFCKIRLWKWKWVISRMLKQIYLNSDRIILFSNRFIPEFQFFYPKANTDKIEIIPNFNVYDRTNIKEKKNIVLSVGRVVREPKRINLLLKIWSCIYKDFPDWELKIVGDGEDRPFLEQMAKDLKLDNYSFEGTQNPTPYYEEASIFCMTSAFESFGMVLTEAMQHKVVPMAFNSYSTASEIINSGYDGYLIKPFDLDEYAMKLSLLMRDTSLREKMADKSYHSVKKFSIDSVGQKWLDLIETLYNE